MWKVGTAGYGNGDHKVEFAIESTGPVTIYWGDGQKTENATTGTHSHTYTSSGDKKIVIAGPLTRFYNPNEWNLDYFGKLTAVTDWGGVSWISMAYMFHEANNLTILPIEVPYLSSVTNMEGMFRGATSFNQPLNNWNVSNVTNMKDLFRFALSFNQPLNDWDVSKVTSMKGIFWQAHAFNQPLNNWNVSNVTDMTWMFSDAKKFNQNINNWNVSKVTSMSYIFQ